MNVVSRVAYTLEDRQTWNLIKRSDVTIKDCHVRYGELRTLPIMYGNTII